MPKLVSDLRLHCDPDCLTQRAVFALGTLSRSLILYLRHAKVETVLRPERASPNAIQLQVGERSPRNRF
jgi:hypothetical protein